MNSTDRQLHRVETRVILSNSLIINAPPAAVWLILTDFSRYAEWNPFTPEVRCTGTVGDPVTLQARLGEDAAPRSVALELTRWEPEKQLCWGADDWYLRVNRCQSLEPLPDGRTRYTNSETFTGILAPLVVWTQRKKLMRGYRQAAEGLKRQVER
jgi:hypothetical protein